MILYPAIDLIKGQVVRLKQGDFNQKTFYKFSALEFAQKYESMGAKVLHLVDLDGAKKEQAQNLNVVAEICSQTNLKVQTGGGIRKEEELLQRFDMGVDRVILGSLAVLDPQKVVSWIQKFGEEKITLSLDGKYKENKFYLTTQGWQEDSKTSIEELISFYGEFKNLRFLCTDIDHDGMMKGPSLKLYSHLKRLFPSALFQASGGVSKEEDLKELKSLEVESCVCGKSLLEEPELYKTWSQIC